MDGLRATAFSVAIVAVSCYSPAVTTEIGPSGPRPPTDWYRATVDSCWTVGWPRCVARNVARTVRLLEDSEGVQIAEGVRLVRNTAVAGSNTKNDDDRSTKCVLFDYTLPMDRQTVSRGELFDFTRICRTPDFNLRKLKTARVLFCTLAESKMCIFYLLIEKRARFSVVAKLKYLTGRKIYARYTVTVDRGVLVITCVRTRLHIVYY